MSRVLELYLGMHPSDNPDDRSVLYFEANARFVIGCSVPNTITASFTASVRRFLLFPRNSSRLSLLGISAAVSRSSVLFCSGSAPSAQWSPIRSLPQATRVTMKMNNTPKKVSPMSL